MGKDGVRRAALQQQERVVERVRRYTKMAPLRLAFGQLNFQPVTNKEQSHLQ
jgi:hypothetical protein